MTNLALIHAGVLSPVVLKQALKTRTAALTQRRSIWPRVDTKGQNVYGQQAHKSGQNNQSEK